MTHVRHLLSSYMDGEVSGKDAGRIEEHLAACARCRSDLSALEAVDTLLQSDPGVEPSAAFSRAVLAKAHSSPPGFWGRVWGGLARPVPLAAAAVLFLLLGLGVSIHRTGESLAPDARVDVAGDLEMLRDYPLLSDLDLLENMDAFSGEEG